MPFDGGDTYLNDSGALNSYRSNSPAGEYGVLYIGGAGTPAGLIFYQAGVAVITASVFTTAGLNLADELVDAVLTGSVISASCDGFRHHFISCSFNNTVELNSKIYSCRKGFNEFNYSSNPTYLSSSRLRVKNTQDDAPVAYATGVGLYAADGALLVTCKFSEVLKCAPDIEFSVRPRLDY